MGKICKLFFLATLITFFSVSCVRETSASPIEGIWEVYAYDFGGRYLTLEELSNDSIVETLDYGVPISIDLISTASLNLSDGSGKVAVTKNDDETSLNRVAVSYKTDKYSSNVTFVVTMPENEFSKNFVCEGYVDEKNDRLIIEFSKDNDINSAIYLKRVQE